MLICDNKALAQDTHSTTMEQQHNPKAQKVREGRLTKMEHGRNNAGQRPINDDARGSSVENVSLLPEIPQSETDVEDAEFLLAIPVGGGGGGSKGKRQGWRAS